MIPDVCTTTKLANSRVIYTEDSLRQCFCFIPMIKMKNTDLMMVVCCIDPRLCWPPMMAGNAKALFSTVPRKRLINLESAPERRRSYTPLSPLLDIVGKMYQDHLVE